MQLCSPESASLHLGNTITSLLNAGHSQTYAHPKQKYKQNTGQKASRKAHTSSSQWLEQSVRVGERREVGGVESHFSDSKRGDPSSTYPRNHPRLECWGVIRARFAQRVRRRETSARVHRNRQETIPYRRGQFRPATTTIAQDQQNCDNDSHRRQPNKEQHISKQHSAPFLNVVQHVRTRDNIMD